MILSIYNTTYSTIKLYNIRHIEPTSEQEREMKNMLKYTNQIKFIITILLIIASIFLTKEYGSIIILVESILWFLLFPIKIYNSIYYHVFGLFFRNIKTLKTK